MSAPLVVVPVYSLSLGSPSVASFHTYFISCASSDVTDVVCSFAQFVPSFCVKLMLGPWLSSIYGPAVNTGFGLPALSVKLFAAIHR